MTSKAPRRRLAVVGSGVAGLTAAWAAHRTWDVTLYEADDRAGGHAHTHDRTGPSGTTVAVDTGFIVHNRRTYPTLLRLFAERRFGGLFITHSVSEAVFLSTKVVVMSGRPGTVVATFDVPFPMPRDPDIRFTAEFAELTGQVSHALRDAHS